MFDFASVERAAERQLESSQSLQSMSSIPPPTSSQKPQFSWHMPDLLTSATNPPSTVAFNESSALPSRSHVDRANLDGGENANPEMVSNDRSRVQSSSLSSKRKLSGIKRVKTTTKTSGGGGNKKRSKGNNGELADRSGDGEFIAAKVADAQSDSRKSKYSATSTSTDSLARDRDSETARRMSKPTVPMANNGGDNGDFMDANGYYDEKTGYDDLVDNYQGTRRSFHQFGQLINIFNLMPQDEREKMTNRLSRTLTTSEYRICRGNVLRRRVREVFHMICYGANVNPLRMRMSVLEYFRRLNIDTIGRIGQLTEKAMLRYIDYWYTYASDETCEWSHFTTETLESMLLRSTEAGGSLLGQACKSCMTHFLRLNHFGRLCPKLCEVNSVAGGASGDELARDNADSEAMNSRKRLRKVATRKLKTKTTSKSNAVANSIAPPDEHRLINDGSSAETAATSTSNRQTTETQPNEQSSFSSQLPITPAIVGGKNIANLKQLSNESETVFGNVSSSDDGDSDSENGTATEYDSEIDFREMEAASTRAADNRDTSLHQQHQQQLPPPFMSRDPRPLSKKK